MGFFHGINIGMNKDASTSAESKESKESKPKPKIPDNSPPPVPPTTQSEQGAEEKVPTDEKKKAFTVSLSKPKNWMARAMNKISGANSPSNPGATSESEKEDNGHMEW